MPVRFFAVWCSAARDRSTRDPEDSRRSMTLALPPPPGGMPEEWRLLLVRVQGPFVVHVSHASSAPRHHARCITAVTTGTRSATEDALRRNGRPWLSSRKAPSRRSGRCATPGNECEHSRSSEVRIARLEGPAWPVGRAGNSRRADQCPLDHTGCKAGLRPRLIFVTVRRCIATVSCNAVMQSASDACGAGMKRPHDAQRADAGRPNPRSVSGLNIGS